MGRERMEMRNELVSLYIMCDAHATCALVQTIEIDLFIAQQLHQCAEYFAFFGHPRLGCFQGQHYFGAGFLRMSAVLFVRGGWYRILQMVMRNHSNNQRNSVRRRAMVKYSLANQRPHARALSLRRPIVCNHDISRSHYPPQNGICTNVRDSQSCTGPFHWQPMRWYLQSIGRSSH